MVIGSISLSVDNPYSQTKQTFGLISASISIETVLYKRRDFISLSIDNPYAKTENNFRLKQVSLALALYDRPVNFLSVSLTSGNGFVQIVDLNKWLTILNA